MRHFTIPAQQLIALTCISTLVAATHAAPAVPPTPREYRGAWCATVTNIDWPAQAGTTAATVTAQKARLIAHLDALAAANMNAIYFQVRPAGDAMYSSPIEPWSQWLTGSQNTNATYDPLTFAVTEAHKRGIELHAWVNPYRAALDQTTSNKSPKHVMRARPDLCVSYTDGRTYMNPGKADTRTWIQNVIADIVTRYDVDGVVFDDYFYPGTNFNDSSTYQAYVNGGGTLSLDNWRRDNVDQLILGCYNTIHGIRNSCQFSVGPFGIWRPGYPSGVTGADYYATHYCDTRKWLQNGWVDSLSPQLYWTLDSTGQPFGALNDWWVAQNPDRYVMPSTADYRVGSTSTGWSNKTAQEIVDQVNRTIQGHGVGNIHYSIKYLTDDPKGVRAALTAGPYSKDVLPPARSWLDHTPPGLPVVSVGAPTGTPPRRTITLGQASGDEKANWWCVNTYNGSQWTLTVISGTLASYMLPAGTTEFAVSAVDRSGNESGFTQIAF